MAGAGWLRQRGWALEQLWLFWLGPLMGAVIGAVTYRAIAGEPS
jgi:aquaporin Z